jgi:hypothetical protein
MEVFLRFSRITHESPRTLYRPSGSLPLNIQICGFSAFRYFFQPYSHTFSQRDNPVFLVFALSDMNGFTFKINVGYFQVNHFLSAPSLPSKLMSEQSVVSSSVEQQKAL